MNRVRYLSVAGVAVVVLAFAGYLASGARPQLGLDLRGGISAVLTPEIDTGQAVDEAVLERTVEVIRARVNSLGIAEPDVSRQGGNILVQLPGVEDPERAREIIGRTAALSFRPVQEVLRPGNPAYQEAPTCQEIQEQGLPEDQEGVLCGTGDSAGEGQGADQGQPAGQDQPVKYRVGATAVSGEGVEDARAVPTGGGNWEVTLDLNSQGGEDFAAITGDLACQRDQGQPGLLAIVLDNVVESAPAMNPSVQCNVGITGGQATITVGSGPGVDQEREARDLALVLRTGALPITLQPSTFETVSPTLGSDSLRAGLVGGLLGLGLVIAYLVAFYRYLGLVVVGALLIFGVVIIGLITAMGTVGFTLTLAGIAGVIVSIGITADSSIIYLERIRDEIRAGRTTRTAVQRAFRSAFRTNLAGNTVTLAAAIILYFLAIGPVRGFALTLGMATVLDILILYFYTQHAIGLLGQWRRLTPRSVRAGAPVPAGGSR